jgi:hypothetical protein
VLDEFFDAFAFVVASDDFVHMPPDSFDGVCFRSISGQKVNRDSVSPAIEVLAHNPTGMERCVVTDLVDVSIAPELSTKFIQVLYEEFRVSLSTSQ